MVVVHAGVEDRDHRALALRAEVPGARVAGPARARRGGGARDHGGELRLRHEAEVVPLLGVVGPVRLVAEERVVRLAGVEARRRCPACSSRAGPNTACPASCRDSPRAERPRRRFRRGAVGSGRRRRDGAQVRCDERAERRAGERRRRRVGGVIGKRRIELRPAHARRALEPRHGAPPRLGVERPELPDVPVLVTLEDGPGEAKVEARQRGACRGARAYPRRRRRPAWARARAGRMPRRRGGCRRPRRRARRGSRHGRRSHFPHQRLSSGSPKLPPLRHRSFLTSPLEPCRMARGASYFG